MSCTCTKGRSRGRRRDSIKEQPSVRNSGTDPQLTRGVCSAVRPHNRPRPGQNAVLRGGAAGATLQWAINATPRCLPPVRPLAWRAAKPLLLTSESRSCCVAMRRQQWQLALSPFILHPPFMRGALQEGLYASKSFKDWRISVGGRWDR